MADISKALKVVRELNPLGLFSRATEEAPKIPQARGTPTQMRAALLKQGVKPDELKWTGFDDWAKGRQSVTRDEVADFLRSNQVRVGETRLGGNTRAAEARVGELENVRQDRRLTDAEEGEYRRLVNILNDDNALTTKFEKYTLPGGENYREVLLTRPPGRNAADEYQQTVQGLQRQIMQLEDNNPNWTPELEEQRRTLFAQLDDANRNYQSAGKPEPSPQYRSPHWDDPDVLAHLRLKDRTDPEGRRILHVEEIQSDWAQEGRKRGFNQYNSERIADLQRQAQELIAGRMPNQMSPEEIARVREIGDEAMALGANRQGVPMAPFVESTPKWTDLALKRALREAVEGNYDALAWTPGAQQAARYPGTSEAGMTGYYDKIVPTQLQKLVRPMDPEAQFGTVNIPTPVRDARTTRLSDSELMAELSSDAPPPQSMQLPSLNITPAMREKIKEGLPLFTMVPGAVGLGMAQPNAEEPRQGFEIGGAVDYNDAPNYALDAETSRFNMGDVFAPRTRGLSQGKNPVRAENIPLARPVAPPEPDVVNRALGVVRAEPRPMDIKVSRQAPPPPRPVPRPAPRPAPAPAAAAPDASESRRLWDIYNETGNPADFVRASNAMRAGRAEGGRLLEDEYPTHYLPNVGRQVMADGGTPDDDIRRYEARMADIARQPEDIRSMTHAPSRPMRPVQIEGGLIGKRTLGEAPYDVAGPLSGIAQTAYSLKTLPFYFTPAAPLAAAADFGEAAIDTAKAAREGDYLGAGITGALGVAMPGYAYRKPIGDVVGRALSAIRGNPGAVGAGAAGAAMVAPEDAEAGKLDAAVRAARRAVSATPADTSVQQALDVARAPSSRRFRSASQPVDATLGVPTENVMFRGKDPADWTPQDWSDFGRQYGVSNLGPSDAKEWQKSLVPYRTVSGREVTLPPGGYSSSEPLTYYDLLHLKSQGINPNDLPPEVHQGIHNRMVRSMQPGPEGPSNEQITNQMIFGLISPNQPLTPNELALQRAMVKGPRDVEAWERMIPYRYNETIPPVAERQALSRGITPRLGLHASGQGGIGASGSANYTDIAEFVQKMKDKPEFYRFNPDDPSMAGMSDSEKWATHVGRVMNATRGLKAKTGSLASVWQSPETAAISAIDRHMATKFRGDMFPSADAKAAWEANVVAKFNEARPEAAVRSIDEMLASPGGRGHFVDNALAYVNNLPAAMTRVARTGEYNPSIPVGLRNLDWPGGEPKKMEMVAGPYVRALEANAEEARRAGQGLFSNQWMLWDRIRNRLEPHEILFPGLEKLPRMSLEQMRRVTKDLSEAGYMAAEGGVRPLPSASRAGYFTVPPVLAGGAALLSPEESAAIEAGVPVERRDGGSVARRAIDLAKELGSSPRETVKS